MPTSKRAIAGLAVSLLAVGVTHAQTYPSKPIRILTVQAGSASDLAARMLAKELQANLGQPVIVDNRGLIAAEVAAQSPPDGHTLLHYTSPLWVIPLFRSDVSWDVGRDYAPIALTVFSPNILVVHPSLPVKSVKELIALARARPGELNYGSSSTGASNHLAGELFKSMANVNIVRIAFKGGNQSVNSLVSGELQLSFPAAASITPQIKAGKVRALAVTSAQPSALAPGLPTMAQSGLPGYETISYTCLFAPAKTPEALVTRLSQETARALNVPAVKERLFNVGSEVVASTPAQAVAAIKSETERIRKLINDAGLREQ
jgi:tripartite-type tricarboxylate transporter receptor subunit TctC